VSKPTPTLTRSDIIKSKIVPILDITSPDEVYWKTINSYQGGFNLLTSDILIKDINDALELRPDTVALAFANKFLEGGQNIENKYYKALSMLGFPKNTYAKYLVQSWLKRYLYDLEDFLPPLSEEFQTTDQWNNADKLLRNDPVRMQELNDPERNFDIYYIYSHIIPPSALWEGEL
jgi:hypothetical protein